MDSSDYSGFEGRPATSLLRGLDDALAGAHPGTQLLVIGTLRSDMNGLRGTTRSSVRVVPGVLRRTVNLRYPSVPSLVHRDEPPPAGSSGPSRVRCLHFARKRRQGGCRTAACARAPGRGSRVWYDEFELRIGDSLVARSTQVWRRQPIRRRRILACVLREEVRTVAELDGIVTRAVSGEQIILPDLA